MALNYNPSQNKVSTEDSLKGVSYVLGTSKGQDRVQAELIDINSILKSQLSGSTGVGKSWRSVEEYLQNNRDKYKSTDGLPGKKGDPGPQGAQGSQGAQGPQGIKGETPVIINKEVEGPQGAQGLQGIQGLQGLQGLNGKDGTPIDHTFELNNTHFTNMLKVKGLVIEFTGGEDPNDITITKIQVPSNSGKPVNLKLPSLIVWNEAKFN